MFEQAPLNAELTHHLGYTAGGDRPEAVPTNARALPAFRHPAIELWRRALRRRSRKDRTSWTDMDRLADRFLPNPQISHPWPTVRFGVKQPRWKPYAGIPPVRFRAEGAQ